MASWRAECRRARVIELGTTSRRQTGGSTSSSVTCNWWTAAVVDDRSRGPSPSDGREVGIDGQPPGRPGRPLIDVRRFSTSGYRSQDDDPAGVADGPGSRVLPGLPGPGRCSPRPVAAEAGVRTPVELTTTGMASGGDAVARDPEGKAVFVRGALPGERVGIKVLADHKKYTVGSIDTLIEASPHRVAPPCPEVDRGCGACQWQHIAIAEQRRLKQQFIVEAIERSGVECPVPSPAVELAPWAFRTSISAGVKNGRAGFNQARSDQIVPVDGCLVAHPLLEQLLVGIRYPGAKSVLLRCGARTGERLVVTTPTGLKVSLPDDVHTEHFHELAADRSWRISARSFFQTRADGADALATIVGTAADQSGSPSTAVDLYSGVGLFAGVLAARGWAVTAVEGSQRAVADAAVNVADMNVTVVHTDVTKWTPHQADLVVADPSRMGLGPVGIDVVAATGARRLILISCDAASLGRDAARLQQAGYSLKAVTHVDLFPHTFRVEAVTVYDR
jgi:23S rRNA (uracil1939-C5)-methyltransferase